ncbi:hypothetical protein QYE76_060961 [Lolium multiflorum]|uniref:F-box domain-containing protein n=1 Tax=Lolium multiflorum TaxID=4521 RepID=A0AAD8W498_LOLMU|nr:hypothetical protein QYE76_060961 [Lolium multiflorum]
MGGCICKPQTAAPWPDLPPEIAGRIFSCLPSHDDRLSFAAVSSRWRIAARLQNLLPPPVPCINLDHGRYQRLVDGEVRRFPAAKSYCAGTSFGGWLFYYHKGSGRCFLRAPVSGDPIELPTRPLPQSPDYVYTDIAFYDGKVFVLSRWEELFCHELFTVGGINHSLIPIVCHDMEAQPAMTTNSYLVVSSDKQKLLMVRWRRRANQPAIDMRVFEADFGKARWLELKDLGDQLLFLGRSGSMAFAATHTEYWGPRFRGGNRVFVLGTEWARSVEQAVYTKRDIPGYCIYDMISGKTSLVSLGRPRRTKSCTSGWFFPTSENLYHFKFR